MFVTGSKRPSGIDGDEIDGQPDQRRQHDHEQEHDDEWHAFVEVRANNHQAR